MSQSAERNLKLLNHMSTFVGSTKPELARLFCVSENTIKADLALLEVQGLVCCPNPEKKPQLWYATRPADDHLMSLELAFVLSQVRDVVKKILPTKLFDEVEHVFVKAASEYESKSKTNHQSLLVDYGKKISRVSSSKFALLKADSEVVEQIKAAMYSGNSLSVQYQGTQAILDEISFIEFEKKLYVEGKPAGFQAKRIKINLVDIIEAFETEKPSFGASLRVAA